MYFGMELRFLSSEFFIFFEICFSIDSSVEYLVEHSTVVIDKTIIGFEFNRVVPE